MSAPPNSRENLLCARRVTSGATMTSGKAHHHPLWEQLVQDERAGRHRRDGARIEVRQRRIHHMIFYQAAVGTPRRTTFNPCSEMLSAQPARDS